MGGFGTTWRCGSDGLPRRDPTGPESSRQGVGTRTKPGFGGTQSGVVHGAFGPNPKAMAPLKPGAMNWGNEAGDGIRLALDVERAVPA